MKLYYHHVGQPGARRDFPRTVFRDLPISLVEEHVPDDDLHKHGLLRELRSRFPSGSFNCWGVPAGAKPVIQRLAPGDFVLLVESVRIDGDIPALAEVLVFPPTELRRLSLALWEDSKYPYIFFFKTERLSLQWPDFLEHLGYARTFDPRGKFYSVADSKLARFGGPQRYVEFLRREFRYK